MLPRHGYKLKLIRKTTRAISSGKESIEVTIRDPDGRKVFHWDGVRGNINQGLYETLDFVDKKLGVPISEILSVEAEE
jgi:hypothetical protein